MPEIEIQAHDGGTFKAYIAYPDTTPAPAVIMIQEIFGVNKEMRDKCDDMADQGYIGIAPDLFWRIEPGIELVDSVQEELERAFHLFSIFDQDQGAKDLESTLQTVRGLEECDGTVASIGYCLGGKMAYRMACETKVDAAVSYYGVGIEAMLDQADYIRAPYLMHIAGQDEFVPKDAQEKIVEKMKDNDYAQTFVYPGMNHAFARGDGMHYNKEAAKLANNRTKTFLADVFKQ